MIELFEHNEKAYNSVVSMLAETFKAAVIHPTGTGKSFIGFKLCEDNPDKVVCWVSPSEYIFKSQLENLAKAANGYQPINIKFFTYAKLMNLSGEELADINPDYIILDEFHRCGAQKWGSGVLTLLNANKDVPVLGMSATNIRYLDNQRDMALELFGGNIASEMTLGEAIVRGILSPPTYILSVFSYNKDLEKHKKRVKRAKNRAVRDEAEKYYEALRRALEKADGLDVLFQKYIKEKNRKFIVFCANAEHMKEMIEKVPEWFGKIDSEPHIYSAYSEDPETSKAFAEFKRDTSGHLKLLFCIDMLNEGIHVEKIDGVILFRPTVSPIVYKQQIGRALSASKDREPIIFDIVNNIDSLYSIDTIQNEMQIAINYYHFFGMDNEIVSEKFKIVDEVQNVRNIFDRLNDTLSASWDTMYRFALRYFEEHGNLEIPRNYKTSEGYSLGNWIFTQRKIYRGETYGTLGKDRIEKLEAIGMVWDSVRDISWKRYYDLAKAYYAEHGNLNIPKDYKKIAGYDLFSWINRMRTYRKSSIQHSYLTEERIAMLDQIGMIWNVPDYLWEENYAAVLEFYRNNGHIDIPVKYCAPNGLKIGTWLQRQRNLRSGKIKKGVPPTAEQINRLDELGMVWKGKFEIAWETGYQAALEYYNEYGNLDVPTTYVTFSGFKLGAWIADRRERRKENHSNEEQQQLDDIGMIWKKPDSWEVRYELAKRYYEEHGDLDMPAQYKVNGIWLSKWINEQRQIYIGNRGEKRLTEKQIKLLEAIGMVWESRKKLLLDSAWNNQFKRVKDFYDKFGHLDISSDYDNGNGKHMAIWLTKQRALKNQGKLTEKQIEMLNSVGMIWIFEDPWEIGFKYAKEYFEKNGNLIINNNYVCSDGYALGRWVSSQRSYAKTSRRKLDESQVERLDSIGMIWDALEFRWNEVYKIAELFYKENGHLKIPKEAFVPNDLNLYEWINTQKKAYRSGKLSQLKIEKLRNIGIIF